jgi:Na+(H+)/acetate symporter ActP
MTTLVLLLLALLVANLPWLSNRLFFVIPLKQQPKSLAWCLFELVVLYFVMGAIAFYTERAVMGQAAPQNWEFYAVTGSLFLVFAFPGFVYRYFWQRS